MWEIWQTLSVTPSHEQFLSISQEPVPGKSTFPGKSIHFLGQSAMHFFVLALPLALPGEQTYFAGGRQTCLIPSAAGLCILGLWIFAALSGKGKAAHLQSLVHLTQTLTLLWACGLPLCLSRLWQPSLPPPAGELSIRPPEYDDRDSLGES